LFFLELLMTAHSSWIDIAVEGGSLPAYLSLPPGGSGPGVVLIQEIFGVNAHIRSVADQYAQAGYVVIAPDIFWRSQPRVELDYTQEGTQRGIELMQQVDLAKTVADIGASAQALRARADVTGKVAAIGYCFGGRLAYTAAAHGLVDAAIAYYGGGIQDNLALAGQVTVPIQFHYGEKDSHITLSAVEQVQAAFKGHPNAQFNIYPNADHGFNCAARASYQQNAAALALGRSLQFLAQNL
jgi:carboxymethylenebutenolidase